ncbi:MAG TPA: hypothetical protein VIK95_02825 [Egibacteraceae bacterium]
MARRPSRRRVRREDSMLVGGLLGIAAVTAATLLLAAIAAVLAALIASFY